MANSSDLFLLFVVKEKGKMLENIIIAGNMNTRKFAIHHQVSKCEINYFRISLVSVKDFVQNLLFPIVFHAFS
jgi:hypothetical protein